MRIPLPRVNRVVRSAEGYLELGMPAAAVEQLRRRPELVAQSSRGLYLLGEALRELRRYDEAIRPLEQAVKQRSHQLHAYLALAWCYKRTGRLRRAIATLERALQCHPGEAIVKYNLSCYWALARQPMPSLRYLKQALDLAPNFIELVADEPDFDPLRNDPIFRMLTYVTV